MIRLYAVVPAGWQAPTDHASIARLSLVRGDEVAVLYDEPGNDPGTGRDDLVAYGQVLTDLAATGPILPIRYGTAVGTLEDLRQTLEQRAPAWRARLAAVADHAEMIVHVLDGRARPGPETPSSSGRDYLMSKVNAHRSGRALYDDLAAAVAPYVSELRRLGNDAELRVACLVPRRDLDPFRAAVERWSASREDRRTRVTGPWPPFSFTEEGDAA